MMGIKTNELRWASQVAAVNPAGFASLEGLASTWGYTNGYDPVTQGLFYGLRHAGVRTRHDTSRYAPVRQPNPGL